MARPMILIKPDLLQDLANDALAGVPISYLIRKHQLTIASPTLARLIHFYNSAQPSATKDPEIRATINRSLFPSWLLNQPFPVLTQDLSRHRYKGRMPLGEWEDVDSDTPGEAKMKRSLSHE